MLHLWASSSVLQEPSTLLCKFLEFWKNLYLSLSYIENDHLVLENYVWILFLVFCCGFEIGGGLDQISLCSNLSFVDSNWSSILVAGCASWHSSFSVSMFRARLVCIKPPHPLVIRVWFHYFYMSLPHWSILLLVALLSPLAARLNDVSAERKSVVEDWWTWPINPNQSELNCLSF